MLYQIGLYYNRAIPLAVFGGSLRKELHSSSIRTNKFIVLTDSSIQGMVCFPLDSVMSAWLS